MLERYDSNLILDYIEDELPPAERAGFEQLLVQDRELRLLVDQLLEDRRLLRQLPAEKAPLEVLDRVQQRMERNMLLDAPAPSVGDTSVERRLRIGRLVVYGSLAAMVLFSAVLMYNTLEPWNRVPDIQAEQFAMAPPAATLAVPETAARNAEVDDREAIHEGRLEDPTNPVAEMDAPAPGRIPAPRSEMTGRDSLVENDGEALRSDRGAAAIELGGAVDAAELAQLPQDEFYAVLLPLPQEQAGAADAMAPRVVRGIAPAFDVDLEDSMDGQIVDGLTPSRHARNVYNVAPRQVEVVTVDPAATHADLLAWANDNGVAFRAAQLSVAPAAPAPPAAPATAESRRRDALLHAVEEIIEATEPPAAARPAAELESQRQQPAEQLVMVVRGEQVPQLIDQLEKSARGNRVSAVTELPNGYMGLELPDGDDPRYAQRLAARQREPDRPAAERVTDRATDANAADRRRPAADSAPAPVESVPIPEPTPEPTPQPAIAALEGATDQPVHLWSSLFELPWGLLLEPQLPLAPSVPVNSDAATVPVIIQITRNPTPPTPDADAMP